MSPAEPLREVRMGKDVMEKWQNQPSRTGNSKKAEKSCSTMTLPPCPVSACCFPFKRALIPNQGSNVENPLEFHSKPEKVFAQQRQSGQRVDNDPLSQALHLVSM